jgi:hypothetical protein
MKSFLKLTALAILPVVLNSCGSGKGGDPTATTRPRTLDGIVLTLDTNVRFELIRNIGTPAALANGDIETGTFFYSLGGVQLRQYPNQGGDNSDTRYPDSITNASYTYLAINETSGLLTLTGIGVNDLVTTGVFNANNGSFTFLFNSGSDLVVNNVVELDLTFTSNGQTVVTGVTTVRIPGSLQPQYDVIRVPTTIRLASGGLVPVNYNPTLDPLRPSRIAPESLNQRNIVFTNGIPDPNLDFEISFTRESVQTNNRIPTELGQGFLRVAGSPVVNAIDYTWTRIGGTDSATMVISNSNQTFDGTYRVDFKGVDNGDYTGTVDGNTPDAAEVSGKFFILNNP